MSAKGNLYLIPTLLCDNTYDKVLPPFYVGVLAHIKHFIVEDIRTARRFLKRGRYVDGFDDIEFFILNKHTSFDEIPAFLQPALDGQNIGLLSEAGCPCIADPGAHIVKIAHEKGISVVPLTGPSSIMLALMASGFNGQCFAFNGYLPIKPFERKKRIKEIESLVFRQNQTQICIETPYRNNHLMQDFVDTLSKQTLLCVACDLTCDNQFVQTKTVEQWRRQIPDLNKRQAVFLVYK